MEDELNGQGTEQELTQPEGQVETQPEAPAMVRIREQEVPVSEIEKVWDTYQKDTNWQKANTQRAQELAEQRKQLDQALKIENFVKEHPELRGELEQTFQKYAKPQTGQLPPEVMQMVEEVKTLKRNFAEREATAEIHNQMKEVKEQFKDFFAQDKDLDKKILQHAWDNNLDNLKTAARDYLFDKAREVGLRAGQQKREQAKATGARLGNAAPGTKGGIVPSDIRKGSYKSLASEFFEKQGIADE
jgi:uncharacterized coiled-coil DUF342 family protein